MTKIKRNQGYSALELYRPTGRPFVLPLSSLLDQAVSFGESASANGDLRNFYRHESVRYSVEDLAMGDLERLT